MKLCARAAVGNDVALRHIKVRNGEDRNHNKGSNLEEGGILVLEHLEDQVGLMYLTNLVDEGTVRPWIS